MCLYSLFKPTSIRSSYLGDGYKTAKISEVPQEVAKALLVPEEVKSSILDNFHLGTLLER